MLATIAHENVKGTPEDISGVSITWVLQSASVRIRNAVYPGEMCMLVSRACGERRVEADFAGVEKTVFRSSAVKFPRSGRNPDCGSD
jgi:hypothetical protein